MILLLSLFPLVYLLLLTWLRNGLKQTPAVVNSSSADEPPTVTIVVAARNEEQNISNLIDHLLNQNYSSNLTEIAIANDHSTDTTGKIIESFANRDSRVKHVPVQNRPENWSPKKWALSKAIETSSGDILLFTDADCRMGPEWVATMVAQFRDSETGLVAGPSPLEKEGGIWNHLLLLDSLGQDALAAGGLSQGIPLTCSGRNLAIRRSAFDSVKGYEGIKSFMSGDDDLLMHKIASAGWKTSFCIDRSAETVSKPPSHFGEFVKQRLRFASKGRSYFDLPFVSGAFRQVLPFIFLTNLSVLGGQLLFLLTLRSSALLPWFLKLVGDGILVSKYTTLLSRKLNVIMFLLAEMWHSLYVVIFGTLGSFLPITWKGRRRASELS